MAKETVYIGIGINHDKAVHKDEAFDYALEQIKNNEEERTEFVEWYFSGNWIEKEVQEDY